MSALRITIDDRDPYAVGTQPPGRAGTDAACTTRDDGNPCIILLSLLTQS